MGEEVTKTSVFQAGPEGSKARGVRTVKGWRAGSRDRVSWRGGRPAD